MTMLDSDNTSGTTDVTTASNKEATTDTKTSFRLGRSKKKAKKVYSPFRYYMSRIFNPNKWSLRTRFVHTTGFLLLLGVVTTLALVAYTLNNSAEDAVRGRLDSYLHLLDRQTADLNFMLLNSVAHMAAQDGVISALAATDRTSLQMTVAPLMDRIRLGTGHPTPHLQFFAADGSPVYNTWSLQALGDERRTGFNMVVHSERGSKTLTGYQVLPNGPVLSAVVPVLEQGKLVGAVEGTTTIQDLFRSMNLSAHYGLAVMLDVDYVTILDENVISDGSGDRLVVEELGFTDMDGYNDILDQTDIAPKQLGHFFIRTLPFSDYENSPLGELILFYDGTEIMAASEQNINLLIWMSIGGSAMLWLALYLNVMRIKNFFLRMKKVIIASHSSDFTERFSSDSVHCLDVMNCPNKECPVYQDPTRICYLETGDEAISPKWRGTCIFLNNFITCKACSVYKMRQGDELMEMRHVINTMMRLWSSFLNKVGKLLIEVLRADSGGVPSLDDVSRYLEQMAGLTVFGHDLQGVYDKSEVYRQLEYVFEHQFGLTRFNLLEVNSSDNRLEPMINRFDLEESHRDVFINCDLCRAKRVAEDVISASNPVLCPYFDIDPKTHVRCCLPMTMGGRVGAVFTFVVGRAKWEIKRHDLGIIKKYLDETAPVLSSLRLLQISKEQALRDPLTMCHNRRFLDEYLAQFEHLNQRNPRKIGFIMADLDHFKMVNDEFGHLAGDQVLQQLTTILRENIRKADMLIRYGGEEFLILLLEVNKEGTAMDVAEKLRKAVEEAKLMLPNGGIIRKTISMGVAEFPGDADQLYRVIKYADVALYQAKNDGRNLSRRFDPEMWTDEDY